MIKINNDIFFKNARNDFRRFFVWIKTITNILKIKTILALTLLSLNAGLVYQANAAPFIENTKTIEVKLRYKTIFEYNLAEPANQFTKNLSGEDISFSIEKNNNFLNDIIKCGNNFILFGTFPPASLKIDNNELNKFETILSKIKKIIFSSFVINSAVMLEDKIVAGASNGNIIEITPAGISIISISSFRGRYPVSKIRANNEYIFICTGGGGIYIYSKNKIYRISEESHKIISNFINDISFFELNGNNYIALYTMNGVSILKTNNVLLNDYDRAVNLKTSSAAECGMFFNNCIYAGGTFGVYKINCLDNFNMVPLKRDFYVRSMELSENNEYLILSTIASGIWKLRKNEIFEKYLSAQEIDNSKNAGNVKSAFEHNGTLYIAHQKGVLKYSNRRINEIFSLNSGFSDRISALASYKKYTAIGTFDKGVYLKDESGNLKTISDFCSDGECPVHINSLFEFNGNLLIGATAGLFVFNADARQITPFELRNSQINANNKNNVNPAPIQKNESGHAEYAEENKQPGINCIHISSNKAFIGTSDGIFVIDEKSSITHLPFNPEIIDKHVYSIFFDASSGIIYAGTYRGFAEISIKDFSMKTYLMINSNMPDNWITAIAPINESCLLIGSYDKGMAIFDKTKKAFTKAVINGKKITLSNMINMNALFNYKNYIFAGTYNGGFSIIKTNGASDLSAWSAKHFTMQNGLCGDMVTSFMKNGDMFYISTFSGLAAFSEADLTECF